LLTNGFSAIKPISRDRWPFSENRIDYGGWIEDIDKFDSDFFKIKDNDAAIMDPQARLILEESLKVIYDAGYQQNELSGKNIGVYIGARAQPNIDFEAILRANNPILGVGQNYLATNISRYFNFTGLSLVLDTACSSGLTALSLASDLLKNRNLDMAMVGVVNLILNPFVYDFFGARNILSKTGEFHIFDKRAGGEVFGEGVGVIMIKRLMDAIKDGNKIYGVIKSIAVNNDGRTLGPGSPNLEAQKEVMRKALVSSGKKVEDVGYIEVNGGGTPVTDTIEIKALNDVYKLKDTNLKSCALGSIKPNIGHVLLSSGLAGFIRCMLSLYHKKIPSFLSAKEKVDYFDFESSRVQFNRNTIDWNVEPGRKRVASQNSFPDGGTNCHVIMEEFVPEEGYEQKYKSLPIPAMHKKRFKINSTNGSGKSEIKSTDINDSSMSITDFKKKYTVTNSNDVNKKTKVQFENSWGKYNE
ncbi:MAG: polyketide synthase, partial [Candidatus Pacearchaeota archaeon]|nr:polyketide synthase [Candidatus Pacearchaeota archaeon]